MSPVTLDQKIECIISVIIKFNSYTMERLKAELKEAEKLMNSDERQRDSIEFKYFALQAKIQEIEFCEVFYSSIKEFSLEKLQQERKKVWSSFSQLVQKRKAPYLLNNNSITLTDLQRYSLNLLVIDDLIADLKNDTE